MLNRFYLVLTDVVRPKLPDEEKKIKVTITPDPAVVKFIDDRVGLGKPFKNRTHGFEFAVAQLMKQEQETDDAAKA